MTMNEIYTRITDLCKQRGITGYRMCKDIGIQPSLLTDLKNDRQNGMSFKKASRIAEYFGISVEFLLTGAKEEMQVEPKEEFDVEYSEYEKELIKCFRRATDDERETIFTVLKKYGLSYPQEETEQSRSASHVSKVG